MKDDRIEGAVTNLEGRVQAAAGRSIGDTKLESEGLLTQAKGTLQNAYGGAVDAARDVYERASPVVRDHNLLAAAVLGGIGLLVVGLMLGRGSRNPA